MPAVDKKRVVAAFDFDGTIIKGDSFWELTQLTHSPLQLFITTVKSAHVIAAYLLKIKSNSEAKAYVFKCLYKGMQFEKLQRAGLTFQREKLNTMIFKEAKEKLDWHKSEDHDIVVVSATFSFLLHEWCAQNHYHLLCTEIEVKEGIVTGNFATPNCFGIEKVNRLNKWFGNKIPDVIYAYGDSKSGDSPMLAMAHHPHFRLFNT